MTKTTIREMLYRFNNEYEAMYNTGSAGTEKDLDDFERIAKLFPEVLQDLTTERQDFIVSDRECAAFARAFQSMAIESLNHYF